MEMQVRSKSHTIRKLFVTYLCTTKAGDEFRNTEYMTLAGGRIASVDVYFGASYGNGRFVKAKGGD
jgi:hypothetical protein